MSSYWFYVAFNGKYTYICIFLVPLSEVIRVSNG